MNFTLEIFDTRVGAVVFYSTPELAQKQADELDCWAITSEEDLKAVTGHQLVATYNRAAKELYDYAPADAPDAVNKFADKRTAVERTWRLLTRIQTERLERGKAEAPAIKRTNRSRGINLAPKDWVKDCRAGSKQQVMVDMLSREQGATFAELKLALSTGAKPWADQTIKSGFNWDMNSLKGYGIRTETAEDGTQTYFLVVPEGLAIPEPRKVGKAPKGTTLDLHSCDTIAETTDGLSDHTIKALWAAMDHAKPSKVNREDASPHDILGENTPAKLWKHIDGRAQHELLTKFIG